MYQFYHFDTYPINKTKDKMSFRQVTKEFMRHPTAILHVNNPLPPKILYGVDAYRAEEIIRERAKKGKDSIGRKLRVDAQVCVSSVTSFPREWEQEFPELYAEWTLANVEYFKENYGDNFLSCIEHLDEEHPNLHFIISINDSKENGEALIKKIHEPIRRRDEQRGSKAKTLVFSEAAREMQDDYYEKVSKRFGLQRIGPGRKRLKRSEYMAAKREAALIAKAIRENENNKKNLDAFDIQLNQKQEKLSSAEIRITAKAKETLRKKEQLKSLEESVNETSNDVIEFENNYLNELYNINPNRFKNFYIKRVTELKNKVTNYTNLYKKYRTKFNELLIKFTNQENKLIEVEKENKQLKTENLKLKTALQLFKSSDTLINKELKVTHHIKL